MLSSMDKNMKTKTIKVCDSESKESGYKISSAGDNIHSVLQNLSFLCKIEKKM